MFKKEDFKVGMVVEINGFPDSDDDGLHVATLDDQENLVFVDSKGYVLLADYNDELRCKDCYSESHIDKVYSTADDATLQIIIDTSARGLLWTRAD